MIYQVIIVQFIHFWIGDLYDPLGTRPLDHLALLLPLDAPLTDLVYARTPDGADEKAKNRGIAQKPIRTSILCVNADAESKYAN